MILGAMGKHILVIGYLTMYLKSSSPFYRIYAVIRYNLITEFSPHQLLVHRNLELLFILIVN